MGNKINFYSSGIFCKNKINEKLNKNLKILASANNMGLKGLRLSVEKKIFTCPQICTDDAEVDGGGMEFRFASN